MEEEEEEGVDVRGVTVDTVGSAARVQYYSGGGVEAKAIRRCLRKKDLVHRRSWDFSSAPWVQLI